MSEEMFYAIWLWGAVAITAASAALGGYKLGASKRTPNIEIFGMWILVTMILWLWPAVVALALASWPFLPFWYLGRRKRKEPQP